MHEKTIAGKLPLLLALVIFSTQISHSQEDPSVSIEPKLPTAGAEFAVLAEIPGVDPATVAVPDPVAEEGLRFLGVDVRPSANESSRGSSLVFRFLALKPGRWELANLEVSIDGKKRNLGSWSIDVQGVSGLPPVSERAEWNAPGSVWQFQQFIVRAIGSDGKILDLPGVPGIENASSEMSADGKALLISSRESFSLPATGISAFGKKYFLDPKKISVRSLPASAGGVFGVGRFGIAIECETLNAEVGDFIPFSIRVEGPGIPIHVKMPNLALTRETNSGQAVAIDLEAVSKPLISMSVRGSAWFCTVNSRTGFYAAKEGVYKVRMDPVRFFDPVSGTVDTDSPRKISITIKGKKNVAPEIDPSVSRKLISILSAFVKKSPEWRDALEFTEAQKYAKALESAMSKRRENLDMSPKEQEIFASLLLLNGKVDEMNAMLLPLERGFWPRADVSRLLDLASALSGFPERPVSLLPAPGVFFLIGAIPGLMILGIALRAAWFMIVKKRRDRQKSRLFAAVLLVSFLLCTICGLLSLAERARPLFVTTGSVVRIVPSAMSTVSFVAPPGFSGRVEKSVSPWFLAAFSDGRNGWILEQDVTFY